MRLSRRQFLGVTAGATTATAAGAIYYTFNVGPTHLRITHRDMVLPNLPDALRGKRLVHISDLHIGKDVDDGFLIRCFERINELQPDILCFTGDFMTCWNDEYVNQVEQVLAHLKPARLATVGVLGNHDYAHRWSDMSVANALQDRLKHTSIELLRNQMFDVHGLQIFGMDDLWAKKFHPDVAMVDLKSNAAHLALAHNPDTADKPVWGGFQGWILSGHTHGGQCRPPFLKAPLLPVENRRYTEGVFDLDSHRKLHINPGLGHLLNVRFMTRPEISVFTLA